MEFREKGPLQSAFLRIRPFPFFGPYHSREILTSSSILPSCVANGAGVEVQSVCAESFTGAELLVLWVWCVIFIWWRLFIHDTVVIHSVTIWLLKRWIVEKGMCIGEEYVLKGRSTDLGCLFKWLWLAIEWLFKYNTVRVYLKYLNEHFRQYWYKLPVICDSVKKGIATLSWILNHPEKFSIT